MLVNCIVFHGIIHIFVHMPINCVRKVSIMLEFLVLKQNSYYKEIVLNPYRTFV